MYLKNIFRIGMVAVSSIFAHADVQGAIIVTEVNPYASGNTPYAADWFELTNTGLAAVDITGWRVDDNSNSFAASVALTGITSIGAGQSVVFIEATPANLLTTTANFAAAWFGANVPTGFAIGSYTGSGIGLGTGGDAVNIFQATGTLVTSVSFGASGPPANLATFDNSAGVGTITTLSTVGVNGAFTSFNTFEVGSPGISAVPEPGSMILLAAGAVAGCVVRRRRLLKRS